jgi:hypothetical protein
VLHTRNRSSVADQDSDDTDSGLMMMRHGLVAILIVMNARVIKSRCMLWADRQLPPCQVSSRPRNYSFLSRTFPATAATQFLQSYKRTLRSYARSL